MDRNCPDHYVEESAEKSLSDTKEFLDYVNKKDSELVRPILTPRFAISCTSELMVGLGELAKKHDLYVQSHISENSSEIAFAESLHPENASYADIYHARNLLNSRTIMAHGVHLKDDELKLFKESGAGVAHCPRSNLTIFSGVAPVRKILKHGVKGKFMSSSSFSLCMLNVHCKLDLVRMSVVDMHLPFGMLCGQPSMCQPWCISMIPKHLLSHTRRLFSLGRWEEQSWWG